MLILSAQLGQLRLHEQRQRRIISIIILTGNRNFDTFWRFEKNQEVCVILTGLGKIDTFYGFEKTILRGHDCTLSRSKISLKDRHV